MSETLYIGSRTDSPDRKECLLLKYANRHGLIAGATGTGKTVTLQGLAENFSKAGVPVFITDVKGDISGLAEASNGEDFLKKRAEILGIANDFKPEKFPVTFWDLFAEQGCALRTTIWEMGSVLLAQILKLNDTQEGVLSIAFRVAEKEGLELVDLKDLRSLLIDMGERAKALSLEYGNISTASLATIQRSVTEIEMAGADKFFGEPAVRLDDFIRTDERGYGAINILMANKLINDGKMYSIFLLWLMRELFEDLPEVGDAEKPKLVFFFDEAHLLFDGASKALVDRVEQVVKLIRSKGVGIYFVTQNPSDIPDNVLGQLGNRIQHALRAFTDKQRKSIKQAAQNYRENPDFRVEDVLTQLSVGEALISTLDNKGQPSIVQRVLIRPPVSRVGTLNNDERKTHNESNPLFFKYAQAIDSKTAYEILKERREYKDKNADKLPEPKKGKSSNRQSYTESFVKSFLRQTASYVSREVIKAIMKSTKR